MSKLLVPILLFLFGMVTAGVALFLVPLYPFRFDAPVYLAMGIRKPQVIGFQPYWLLGKAEPEVSGRMTTLTYFGLAMRSDGHLQKLVNPQEEEPGWTTLKNDKFGRELARAKVTNRKLSLLIQLFDEEDISTLLVDPVTSAQNLVSDVVPVLKTYGFSDLNLDIESFQDRSILERNSFSTFVSEVKAGLLRETEGKVTLTIELTPIGLVRPRLHDNHAMGQIADTVVLMAYDYHYSGSFVAGPVAPIGGVGTVRELDVESSIAEAVNVIPAEKLVLGIPLYGYEYETIGESPGSAAIPGGTATASLRRIHELLVDCPVCQQSTDPVSGQPIVTYPENDYFNQVYYENDESLKKKIELVGKYDLGGIAFWALGYEDETIAETVGEFSRSYTVL